MNVPRRILVGTIIAFLLQTVMLGGMIARHVYALRSGEPLILNAEPVDPRHPFLGHYLALRFPISGIREPMIQETDAAFGQVVYVTLDKAENETWHVADLHTTMPSFSPEAPVLRGRIVGGRVDPLSELDGQSMDYEIRYGIEHYYLPERDANAMEKHLAKGELQVEVSVSPSTGRTVIKRILVNGESVYQDPLF